MGLAPDLPIQLKVVSSERFWARLSRHREDVLDISQDDIAARLHVTQQRVSDMEKSDVLPRGDRMHAIAEAYEVDPATLFQWAAEASRTETRRAHRETADIRKQHQAVLEEMRQIVKENRDINEEIGKNITQLAGVLQEVLAAIRQLGDSKAPD